MVSLVYRNFEILSWKSNFYGLETPQFKATNGTHHDINYKVGRTMFFAFNQDNRITVLT